MKKKGRIAGTIGLVLSVVLAGSTIVYGTMVHKNSEGRSRLGGDSTGNYFSDILGKDKNQGFQKTLDLVTDTYAGISGTEGTNKYSSFTASFTYTYSLKSDSTTNNVLYNTTVCANKKYARLTETVRYTGARETTIQINEYVLVKSSKAVYKRSNPTLTTSAADDEILDTATWSLATEYELTNTAFVSFVKELKDQMSAVESGKVSHNKLTGEYTFTDEASVETMKAAGCVADTIKADYSFNVGSAPTVAYEMQGETKKRTQSVYGTAEIKYSSLNATTVELPETLVKLVGKEA